MPFNMDSSKNYYNKYLGSIVDNSMVEDSTLVHMDCFVVDFRLRILQFLQVEVDLQIQLQ